MPHVGQLLVLRPVSVIFCGLALIQLKKEHVTQHRAIFLITGATFILVILHLIPLPPALWSQLPGRDILEEIDRAAGLAPAWRPLSMTPAEGWNALYSLFTPLAVLLLGVQLQKQEKFTLLLVIIMLGLLSGFIGIMQIVGDPKGPLFFYRITNWGEAVGLFANRNHQAVLLAMLFPMIAVAAAQPAASVDLYQRRLYMLLAIAALLLPLILVTGSRAGLLMGVVGLLASPLLFARPHGMNPKKRKMQKINWAYPIIALVMLGLGFMTIILSRARAFERLFASDQLDDIRRQSWPILAEYSWDYFPFGSGIGSLSEIFKMVEPDHMLRDTYLNHAHNDWLEIYFTGGLPAITLLCAGLYFILRSGWRAFRSPKSKHIEVRFARLGFTMALILLITSIADYPLRVPIMMSLFVIAALWMNLIKPSGKSTKL